MYSSGVHARHTRGIADDSRSDDGQGMPSMPAHYQSVGGALSMRKDTTVIG
jgi:hypothetical protein